MRLSELLQAVTYFLWSCHAARVTPALKCVLKSSDLNLAWHVVNITEYFCSELSWEQVGFLSFVFVC